MTNEVMKFGIGQAMRRPEDARLLTGGGNYLDDKRGHGELAAVFVRSPHAHARIVRIDTTAANAGPDVAAVYTGAEWLAQGFGAVPFRQFPDNPQAMPLTPPPRYPLTPDVARFVGDPLVMIVAGTEAAALDAAERIEIEFEILDSIINPAAAIGDDAVQIWPDAPNNIAGTWAEGDKAAVDAVFAEAAHVVSLEVINNRLIPNSMEPRGALAQVAEEGLVLQVGCQMPHLLRDHLCDEVLHMDRDRLRVVVPDIGGGFGAKVFCYPEYAAVLIAAQKLGRGVRWQSTRSEAFLSDIHGRDQVNRAELAIDDDGNFLALREHNLGNMGAYISFQGAFIPALSSFRVLNNVYDIPHVYARCDCVLTNTSPTDAYRGAGRPEAVYLMERLVDLAAIKLNRDPIDLRRQNLVPASAMPYTNPLGLEVDSGNFEHVMDAAMAAHDWVGAEARRREAEARGKFFGRGLAMFIEHTGRNEHTETVDMAASAGGKITVLSGTQEMGQGIKTSYLQLAAAQLEISPQHLEIVQGDTARVASGGGSGGSRSLFVGGSAVNAAAGRLVEKGREMAADELEAAVADMEYAGGIYCIAGTDRTISLFDLAAKQDAGILGVSETTTAGGLTWPNGCHICEVEIDPETGAVALTKFTGIDDVGVVVNPMIVSGQSHGGIAQGIGQALFEHTHYDGSGQLLSGSFLDYTMPRAGDLPSFVIGHDETAPCTTNLLGAKGAGEAGATGAPPAVVSAIIDALKPFGVTHLDMPIRQEDIWRAINNGSNN